jgi:21S rRNA (GM2251-2'-O)-methyltransferase
MLASLLRAGFSSRSRASSPGLHPTTATRARTRTAAGSGDSTCRGLGGRVSFSTAPDVGRALPWLADDNGNVAPAARTSAARSLSWEASAEKFSKDERYSRREVSDDRASSKVAIGEEV